MTAFTQRSKEDEAINMLILTDFSSIALNALGYAVALCQQLKTSRIILYHSYEYIPNAFTAVPPLPVYSHEDSIQKLTELKNQIQHLVPENTVIDILGNDRPLLKTVKALVKQEEIGLVVMGIKGKSNLDQMLIGSNTITVAKECTAPLLIVPLEAEFDIIQKVVFACDLKKVSTTTPVNAIKIFIHQLEAKLFILNVNHSKDYYDPDIAGDLADLHNLWDNEKPLYYYIQAEDISTGIVEFATEHQIQLILTVPKVYGFFDSIFHRSVTKKLAYHTHLPLLLFNENLTGE